MPVKAKNTSDPKTTALAYMGIAIGSKNLKTLKREEIDEAFTSQFIAAVTMQECAMPFITKMGSKRQYQRVLHESYQFLVKYVGDQQAIENPKKKTK